VVEPSAPAGGDTLDFDRVATSLETSAATSTGAVTCTACKRPITTEYDDINGHNMCLQCRMAIEAAVETPTGMAPLV